jgi:HD-GYP domain-containing protein (c-di-GMP phosphodiesterase class II)
VTDLAVAIAIDMGFLRNRIDGIRMAGLIHDIGKISVPAEILSKPGNINDKEFALIMDHPQVGYDILKAIEFPSWKKSLPSIYNSLQWALRRPVVLCL